MVRASTLLLSLAVLASPALGQTYDLRKLTDRDPQVGDLCEQTLSDGEHMKMVVTNQGNVVNQEDKKSGHAHKRTLKVVKEGLHHLEYTSFKDLATDKEVEVKGLKVVVTKGEDGTWTPKGDGAELPPVVAAAIQKEYDSREADAKKDESESMQILMPAKPVAVGATWKLDPAKVGKAIFSDKSKVKAAGSSGKGELKGLENGLLHIVVDLTIEFELFEGSKVTKPSTMVLKLDIYVWADGTKPFGHGTMAMTMKGSFAPADAPPGIEVSLDMNAKKTQRFSGVK